MTLQDGNYVAALVITVVTVQWCSLRLNFDGDIDYDPVRKATLATLDSLANDHRLPW